jgi:hypothetical protein
MHLRSVAGGWVGDHFVTFVNFCKKKPSWEPGPRLLLAVVPWFSGYKWAFTPFPLFACRKGFRGTVSFFGAVSFFTGIVSVFTGTGSGI